MKEARLIVFSVSKIHKNMDYRVFIWKKKIKFICLDNVYTLVELTQPSNHHLIQSIHYLALTMFQGSVLVKTIKWKGRLKSPRLRANFL